MVKNAFCMSVPEGSSPPGFGSQPMALGLEADSVKWVTKQKNLIAIFFSLTNRFFSCHNLNLGFVTICFVEFYHNLIFKLLLLFDFFVLLSFDFFHKRPPLSRDQKLFEQLRLLLAKPNCRQKICI